MFKNIIFPSHFSKYVKGFITDCTMRDPKKRQGSDGGGILNIFKHKWMSGLSRKLVNEKKIAPPFVPKFSSFNFDFNFEELHYIYSEIVKNSDPKLKLENSRYNQFQFEYDHKDHKSKYRETEENLDYNDEYLYTNQSDSQPKPTRGQIVSFFG